MEQRLTVEDARQSLTAHAAEKGAQLFEKYGPRIGWKELDDILKDRAFVRYPCEISFDAAGLLPGEMAHPFPNSDKPEDGFKLHIHPVYQSQLERVPALALYQVVLINYGEFASASDAEAFGAAALGLSTDDYYELLCRMWNQFSRSA